jgi:hypothetical protein
MKNLTHSKSLISEGLAMNLIFDACRSNVRRGQRYIKGFDITFTRNTDGTHRAVVFNKDGTICATANVDRFDC